MIHPFGQSFTRWFFPLVDDATPENLPISQNPAIYLFENQPSRSQGQSGTGALQTITTWEWDSTRNGWKYTVAPVNDPQPTSSDTSRIYWEAVNFVLQTGAQVQTDIRSIEFTRASGHASTVGVNDAMLRQYFPQLDSCSNEPQRYHLTNLAIEDVKARLKDKGYEWARITRPDRLTIAVAYKVLYMIMLVQIQQGNDKYAIKYTEFKGIYDSTIDSLSLEYDSNKDGLPDAKASGGTSTAFIIR